MEDAILDTASLQNRRGLPYCSYASSCISYILISHQAPVCRPIQGNITTKCQQKIIIRIYRKIYYETNLIFKMTLCILLIEYA